MALVLAIPVVLLAGAVFATANVQRNAALLSAREQAASQSLLTAMLDQETGARGLFQTDQRLFLQPWTEGTSAFGSRLAELRSLVSGNSALKRLLADQAQRAINWHGATAAAILALERTGHTQSAALALRGKEEMDGFRAANAAFDGALDEQRSKRLSTATTVSVGVAVALAALLAGGGLLLSRRFARSRRVRTIKPSCVSCCKHLIRRRSHAGC
jgi:CHASE3 domain sensor protein